MPILSIDAAVADRWSLLAASGKSKGKLLLIACDPAPFCRQKFSPSAIS
jgi:hypothetical protein